MKFLAMHITNQKLSFDIFTVRNLQNIFMEHDLNILMIFGIKEKCIILTHTMYCCLLLQIYLCYLWLLLCCRDTYEDVWMDDIDTFTLLQMHFTRRGSDEIKRAGQDPPSGPNVPLQPSLSHRTRWTLKRTCSPARASSSASCCSPLDSSSWAQQVSETRQKMKNYSLWDTCFYSVTVSFSLLNPHMLCSGHFDPERIFYFLKMLVKVITLD